MPSANPNSVSKSELLELIYEADTSEHGLAIESDHPKNLYHRLSPMVKAEDLKLSVKLVGEEVWLIKTGDVI